MTRTCKPAEPAATGKTETFSQLRLALCREVGREGLFLKNSQFTEGLRRGVVSRLPRGAVEDMSELLGVRPDSLYAQHEGEVRYSLDAFVVGLMHLQREDARHVLRLIAHEIGAVVVENPFLEDEAMR
jgi:hypothetical protein